MPLFRCEIIDSDGKLKLDLLEANTVEDLGNRLRKNGAVLYKAVPTSHFPRKNALPANQLIVFTRKFYAYLRANIPLGQVFTLLAKDTKGEFGEIILILQGQILEGVALHKAMALFPEKFSPLYINGIRMGEESGNLPSFLKGLLDHLTAMKKIREEIISAMTYPLILVVVAIITVVFLATTTIPVFESAIRELGGSLHWLTMSVIEAVRLLKLHFWSLILTASLAYIWVIPKLLENEKLIFAADRMVFSFPILSSIAVHFHGAMFGKTMHLMLSRGINLMEAISISIDSTSNGYLKNCMTEGFRKMGEGSGLRAFFSEIPVFENLVKELSLAGEESGSLSEMFSIIHETEYDEMNVSIKRLLGLLEPMFILVTGCLIGTILVSMFLPIFQLGGAIR